MEHKVYIRPADVCVKSQSSRPTVHEAAEGTDFSKFDPDLVMGVAWRGKKKKPTT